MLKMILFQLLFLAVLLHFCHARHECSTGIYACDVPSSWPNWSQCSVTCGGGTQKRQKSICCDPGISTQQCLASCNKTRADLEEIRPCAKTCLYGTYDPLIGRCQCQQGYGGHCCDYNTPTKTNDADNSCFKSASVKTLMAFLIVFVIGLAVTSAVLAYITLKLRKQLSGMANSKMPAGGFAPSATIMKK